MDEGILLRPKTGRRMYVTKEYVRKMGMTPGCEGCRPGNRGEKKSVNHTEECRTKMETAVAAYDAEKV